MTGEEYKQQWLELNAKLHADIDAIADEYLKSVFPYKIGDVVEDYEGKGIILSMSKQICTPFDKFYKLPYYHLELERLKKDGTPMKIRRIRDTESYNIKRN